MIEDAEKDGRLKTRRNNCEGTSGNTGMGLTLADNCKRLQMYFVISDKQSKKNQDILRAVGAK